MEVGSVADWVSGLGTMAAALVALAIYAWDRNQQRHEAPNGVYLDRVPTRHVDETTDKVSYEVRVRLYNGGPNLLGEVILTGPRDRDGHSVMTSDVNRESDGTLTRVKQSRPVLAPGEEGEFVLIYDHEQDLDQFYVAFRDHNGRRWEVNVGTRKRVGRLEARRRRSLTHTMKDVTLRQEA